MTAAPHHGRHRGSAGVVALVCLGLFMMTLDSTIVNISLPSIGRAFHVPLGGSAEWVVICYLVVIAALLPTFGRLSDAIGRRPVWLAGLVVFTAGSAACGSAPSLGLLVAARALQGVGGALIFATSSALLTDAVPESRRGHALGWSSVAIALGSSAGPTIGGLLTGYASWRWIFYVNVPLGLVAVAATVRLIPRMRGRPGQKYDVRGALLLAAGLSGLTLGLSFGQEWGWLSPRLLGALAFGAVALVAAVLVELSTEQPVLDVRLFRDRVFASAALSRFCSMLGLFAIGVLFPFYAEELRGLSPARAGLLITPYPVAVMIVGPAAGALSDRVGSRWLAPLALVITAAGLVLLAQLDAASSTWAVVWRLALTGAGTGLFQAPNTRAIMSAAPDSERGMASAVYATTRVTGQALSVAVAGAIFASFGGTAAASALSSVGGAAAPAYEASRLALQTEFLRGLNAAWIASAVFSVAGALAALVRGRERSSAAAPRSDRATSAESVVA